MAARENTDQSLRESDLATLAGEIEVCRRCERLVRWREQVAREKRAAFADQTYWGRPLPGFGDPAARIAVLGLAPAAHGGNRTGRVFTGDRSGDVLFASLHRCGFAAIPTSVTADDGQRLTGARMAAAVRCAPPVNKPEVSERDACAPWLHAELAFVAGSLRVIVCLGGFAWDAAWAAMRAAGFTLPRPKPKFGHGAEVTLAVPPGYGGGRWLLLGCYHPSQQNTFTGRVTPAMLDDVFMTARERAEE
ncbi:MAG TPA: uracil-DNA glycosylase [Solirubrobacteraceae bacterium]